MYLFLDDERNPEDVYWADLPKDVEWTIVRNYNDFCDTITKYGMPTFISFDHDIACFKDGKEYNGNTCALWLTDYCLDNNCNLPEFLVHSKNPEGKKNIEGTFNSFKKHIKKYKM